MKYHPTTPPWAGPGPGPKGGVLSGGISLLFLCFSMILGLGWQIHMLLKNLDLGLGLIGCNYKARTQAHRPRPDPGVMGQRQ